ncbi:MAG TPA: hypothetical protein VEQ59_18765, partial [Polyangiaceae bacterium]|nr:hypothetical protein [Polyangiaceae bacterium]
MKATLLTLAALALGCSAQNPGPGLLQLTELSAREVGRGDKLEITGAGFPEGRVARLTFRGDVYRPGRVAAHDVEISIPARTSTPHVLEAAIPEELVSAFCGRDDGAHATFRGDVTAAFAPRKSGAPPVAGTLQDVVLDVEPSRETEDNRALATQEGQRFAAFLGVTLSADGSGPLRIQKLEPQGRAAEVGLAAGDVIEEVSGVRVSELSDFVPPPRARTARIGLHRGGVSESAVMAIDVAEFKPGTLSDLTPALALVGSALLALLLALSPLGRFSTWLALAIASRTRARGDTARDHWLSVARGLSGALPEGTAAYFGVALGSSLLALGALSVPLVARELDLPILLLASGSALVVAGALSQLGQRGKLAALSALKRALWVLLAQLPLASAMLVGVLSVGSLRADDFASAQAGMPWRFLAFASPIHFMALLLGVFALVPEATLFSSPSSSLPRPVLKRSPALPAVAWAHLVVSAGLLSITLLGGFAVPWLSELDRLSSAGRMATGAVLLVLKTFGLVLIVAALRWAVGRV